MTDSFVTDTHPLVFAVVEPGQDQPNEVRLVAPPAGHQKNASSKSSRACVRRRRAQAMGNRAWWLPRCRSRASSRTARTCFRLRCDVISTNVPGNNVILSGVEQRVIV